MISSLTLTYLGTNSLVISDTRTKLLIDPHFTRPANLLGPAILYKRIEPNKALIASTLAQAGVTSADAILITHTHYDHALDAVDTALLTGAPLIGSVSVSMLPGASSLPGGKLVSASDHREFCFGNFSVTFLPSRHLDIPLVSQWTAIYGRQINKTFSLPASALAYKVGDVFNLQIKHPIGSILILGTASPIPTPVDTSNTNVALSVGGLNVKSKKYIEQYIESFDLRTGRCNFILTHWDDFSKQLYTPACNLPGMQRVYKTINQHLSKKTTACRVIKPQFFDTIVL